MKFTLDESKFDELQPWFVYDVINAINDALKNKTLSEEERKDLCGTIAFYLFSLIDNSAQFEVEGKAYKTIVAFSEKEGEFFHPDGETSFHDYVYGVLDEVFEEDWQHLRRRLHRNVSVLQTHSGVSGKYPDPIQFVLSSTHSEHSSLF